MKSSAGSARTSRIGPCLTAVAILLASGVGYRTLAARLAQVGSSLPIASGTLAQVPLTLGSWTGEDVPLDPAIVKRTDTDDHINRFYHRAAGREAASVFFAYGVRMRDLLPHRPEVCFPGAGWTLDHSRTMQVTSRDGSVIPCRVHDFHRGTLDTQRVTVLNYFLVDGRYLPDVADLRKNAWKPSSAPRYVARVQITSSSRPLGGSAEEVVTAFAADSADDMRRVVSEALAEPLADQGSGSRRRHVTAEHQ